MKQETKKNFCSCNKCDECKIALHELRMMALEYAKEVINEEMLRLKKDFKYKPLRLKKWK